MIRIRASVYSGYDQNITPYTRIRVEYRCTLFRIKESLLDHLPNSCVITVQTHAHIHRETYPYSYTHTHIYITTDNITVIIETHENKWIKRHKTLAPNGFNIKPNHPQNIALTDMC